MHNNFCKQKIQNANTMQLSPGSILQHEVFVLIIDLLRAHNHFFRLRKICSVEIAQIDLTLSL